MLNEIRMNGNTLSFIIEQGKMFYKDMKNIKPFRYLDIGITEDNSLMDGYILLKYYNDKKEIKRIF